MIVLFGVLVVIIVLGALAILVGLGARGGSRFSLGLGAALGMLLVAAMLYLFAFVLAWNDHCDGARTSVGGIDKPMSLWPPASKCPPYASKAKQRLEEPYPILRWGATVLVVTAPLVLLAGIGAGIRDNRKRLTRRDAVGSEP